MTNDLDLFKEFYNTANLWTGKLLGLEQFYLSQLKLDLKNEENFRLPEIPERTVLGKRAEYFFKFCIEQSSNYELLLSNIQIFRGKITIGELDFIIKNLKNSQIIHVELVYKFYIYNPNIKSTDSEPTIKELSHYQGPNGKDHLVRKINHLKNHQLPLLYSSETSSTLINNTIDIKEVKQQVCFLAHLFIPHNHWNHKFAHINKSCIVGYYYVYSAFAKAETKNTYFIPEKFIWKRKPHVLTISYTFQEAYDIITESLKRGFAPLVWMQIDNSSFEQFFVVK